MLKIFVLKYSFLLILTAISILIGSTREKALAGSFPCNDQNLQAEYDAASPKYHSYEITNQICSKSLEGCTTAKVFSIMRSQERFIAPTFSQSPVKHCKANTLIGDNPIKTTVDSSECSVANYTLPGHMFHPGKITRKVVDMGDSIAITTVGEGTGDWRWLNNHLGRDIWNGVDSRLSVQVRLALSTESDANPNIAGTWSFRCCQNKYWGEFKLFQDGNKISGKFISSSNSTLGKIDGTIQGDRVEFTRAWEDKSQSYVLTLSPDGQVLEGTFRGNKDPDQSIGVEFRATRQGGNNRTSLDGLWNDAWGTGAWRIQHDSSSDQFTVFFPQAYQMRSGRKGPYEGRFMGKNEISVRFYDDPANPSSCCTAKVSSNGNEME